MSLKLIIKDEVGIITIDREKSLNALNKQVLKEILKNYIETIKFASHLLEAIPKNYMGTFIWRETFSNSSKS